MRQSSLYRQSNKQPLNDAREYNDLRVVVVLLITFFLYATQRFPYSVVYDRNRLEMKYFQDKYQTYSKDS